MDGNIVLSDDNVFRVLHYIWQSIDFTVAQYCIIWFGIIITTIIIIMFSRVPEITDQGINRIVDVPLDEFYFTSKEKKINEKHNIMKSKVMIDHIKYLRELNTAAERCYIKKNAMKCIEIISYCPHLINVKNKESGMTPFHKVCSYGHVCLISYMLEKGANPWLTTDTGETALCLAIQACIKNPEESLECLEKLQKYGCYLDQTNKWYKIYLEAALLTNHQPLVRWIFDQSPMLGKRYSSFPLTYI